MYRERHGRKCATNGRSVITHHVDEQIAEIFRSFELPQAWRRKMAENVAQACDAVAVASLRQRRLRVGRAYADGTLTEGEYEARPGEIDG